MTNFPTDNSGRAYATLKDLTIGCTVQVDGDFTCMEPWSKHTIHYSHEHNEFYIKCSEGYHGMGGQLQDDDNTLIGVYLCDNSSQPPTAA